jgi:hypothetical protein
MVREQLEETLVLVQKPAVDDLPALAQSVGFARRDEAKP